MSTRGPGPEIVVCYERPSPRLAVISVAGQVDLYTAPELKIAVSRAIDDGATQLVVDLTETGFVDSTALGVLVGAMKRLRPAEGTVEIVCPHTSICRLFELAGLADRFVIHESREQVRMAQ